MKKKSYLCRELCEVFGSGDVGFVSVVIITVMQKNIAFIINPISGTANKRKIVKLIDQYVDREQWAPCVVYTEYKGHATELAQQYAAMGFEAVVAVGGDGTVNEVASGLRHTQTALGIIPIGSGNGFARHLEISLRTQNAVQMLNNSEPIVVDYAMVENQPFFTTCGTGFDAQISEEFAAAGKRGFVTYLQHIVRDFFSYKPQKYTIISSEKSLTVEAFLVTCANANQWGNAAYIAPRASMQDGLLDITVLSPFPMSAIPGLAFKLFEKSIDESLYITTWKAKQVTIIRESEGAFHFDGEPITMPAEVNVKIVPQALRVLVEKRY